MNIQQNNTSLNQTFINGMKYACLYYLGISGSDDTYMDNLIINKISSKEIIGDTKLTGISLIVNIKEYN
ncbi:Hypothetical protein ORPV_53 [Orpheovirus IHUMI-LCC2]|uniref:Uncharacterized protein n=1 Tax=Orpheovirus IHUMI-LCC2 TaxID=2023057 RepID=A0A2I2L364_9VIRU|nr:Hypothetical protein ORPV_53 [Orpheovirus IHUMI-LCC2]SNW61957.1 Hypothetical protein ORPV_53 [Orpheovirus IHUMI-LCC2]